MPTNIQNPILEVHDLIVSYKNKPVLWNIDFGIPKGVLCGIIGPNGAGKSTLLKTIMNIIDAEAGYVELFGQEWHEVKQKISYVPQTESVDWDFPTTVLEVVLMGRYNFVGPFKRWRKIDVQVAKECLDRVGMLNFHNRQISQLSGGQQQRVFIARALAQEAELYLMDEPMAGIDASSEAQILNILQEMRSEGKTIVVVHHDLHSAYEYFDWVVLLNTRLIAAGEKSEVFNEEYLSQTYGGTPAILSIISEVIRKGNIKLKEKEY